MTPALALLATASPAADPAGDELAACEAEVRARPDDSEAYLCFHRVGRQENRVPEARERLVRLASELPFDGWVWLVVGHLEQILEDPAALETYRRAAESFAARGEARGEMLARHNRRNLLHRRGESAAAEAEVTRIVDVAERSGKPALLAQALVVQGTHRVETGGDLALARANLLQARALLPADASYPQRKLALLALAAVSYQLARYDEAIATYDELLALTVAQGDAPEEATTRFNIANARQRQLEERHRPGDLDSLEPLAAAALESARRSGNRGIELRASAILAQVARGRGEIATARSRLREALAMARDLGHPERIMICLWALAELAADDQPAVARAFSDEAAELALATGNDRHLAFAWRSRMRVDWRTRPRAEAATSSDQALGAIEALAARQGDDAATVGLFGAWARDYRWLAGKLLDGETPEISAAFAVMERMRARVLVAALAAERKGDAGLKAEGGAGAASAADESDALREVIAIQRELLVSPRLDRAERDRRLAALAEREAELAAARAAREGGPARGEPSDFAALSAVQEKLGPREALLAFQLAPSSDLYGDFAGGSWVIAVTAQGASAHRLPDPDTIDPRVALFLALVERRDGSESAAGERLWELLLAGPLSALPAEIERLLVVPDGTLFSLPFELLAPPGGLDRRPLGVARELAIVPSATALLRWRGASVEPPRRSVLVLADPEPPREGDRPAATRDGVLGDDLALGRLPGAAREGRVLVRRLAPTSELASGAAASALALNRADLGQFAVLHFATHALSDGLRPERSAVLLASSDAADDGLLQSREIARLPLAGRVVVLSGCRTAAGEVAAGEGPLSLARAFQLAGARAVVASRWVLRDEEAGFEVERLYDHLAEGATLGAALRAAREEAWASGRPAAAWAAWTLTGEPGVEVFAGLTIADATVRSTALRSLAIGLAIAGLVAIAVSAGRRFRRLPKAAAGRA